MQETRARLPAVQRRTTRGTIHFPQDKEPAWAYQEWPEVPIFAIQYDQPDRLLQDAQILWPQKLATTEQLLLKP